MTKRRTKSLLLALLMGITAIFFPGCSKEEAYRLVKVNSYDGEVTVQREEKLNAFEGLQLISEDTVSVGEASFLELLADSDKHIAAEENTGFVLHSTGDDKNGSITIDLLYGRSLFTIDNKLNEGSTFAVITPNATLSVRGTSFAVGYDEETKTTDVEVYSGTVQLNSGDEEMLIKKDGKATVTTTDNGVTVVTNNNEASAGNPNAIAVPENTEKLFAIAMIYPQEEGYNVANAEYLTTICDYTANETKADSNSKIFKKYIEIIKSHNSDISKYFEENKTNAVANTNKQADVTDWFGEMFSVEDKGFRIDKAIMDISISGGSVKKEYATSETYKINQNGIDMYFCANGVEISFYGGFEEVEIVDEGPVVKQVTYTYFSTDGTVNSKAVIECDKLGRSIKETIYDDDGSIKSYEIYKYNEDGRIINNTMYHSDGEAFSVTDYEYDSNGNNVKSTNYWGESSIRITTYEYDSNNMLKTAHYENKTVRYDNSIDYTRYITNYEYVLDSEGRVLERTADTEYEHTDEHYIHVTTYNDKGKVIEERSTTTDADKYTYDYTYDDYGFCTKIVTYKDGVLNGYGTYEQIFWDESELQ